MSKNKIQAGLTEMVKCFAPNYTEKKNKYRKSRLTECTAAWNLGLSCKLRAAMAQLQGQKAKKL